MGVHQCLRLRLTRPTATPSTGANWRTKFSRQTRYGQRASGQSSGSGRTRPLTRACDGQALSNSSDRTFLAAPPTYSREVVGWEERSFEPLVSEQSALVASPAGNRRRHRRRSDAGPAFCSSPLPHLRGEEHNDVTRFAFGVVGFVFAFFIGFVVSA